MPPSEFKCGKCESEWVYTSRFIVSNIRALCPKCNPDAHDKMKLYGCQIYPKWMWEQAKTHYVVKSTIQAIEGMWKYEDSEAAALREIKESAKRDKNEGESENDK